MAPRLTSLDLTSVEARLRRAKTCADSLKQKIGHWADKKPYGFIIDHNDDHSVFRVRTTQIGIAPPLEEWGLIVSECLHHTRSALDNLVYAIAELQASTWPLADKTLKRLSFPLIDDPKDWAAVAYKIEMLSSNVRQAMESVQPYHRTHQELPPLLAVLRDGNDWDKHRLLVEATLRSRASTIQFEPPISDAPFIKVYEVPLADGAVLAKLTFRRPQPHTKINTFADCVIAMRHATGPKGATYTAVGDLMPWLIAEAREVIDIVRSAVK